MTQYHYIAFELRIRCNFSVPCLQKGPAQKYADVDVEFVGSLPDKLCHEINRFPVYYASPYRDNLGIPQLEIRRCETESIYYWRFGDGSTFKIARVGSGCQITVWTGTGFLESVVSLLLGQILGFVLRLRGSPCLHAGAVAISSRAIVFIGESGAGKSTTTALWAKLGHPVLADDKVALVKRNETTFVLPGYPCVRLFPDSIEELFGEQRELPRIIDNTDYWDDWDKRWLHLDVPQQFHGTRLPLGAIYILGERTDKCSSPRIEKVTPAESFLELVRHSYLARMLDRKMRASDFEVLGQLLPTVPVRRITRPAEFAAVSQMEEVILNDLRAIL